MSVDITLLHQEGEPFLLKEIFFFLFFLPSKVLHEFLLPFFKLLELFVSLPPKVHDFLVHFSSPAIELFCNSNILGIFFFLKFLTILGQPFCIFLCLQCREKFLHFLWIVQRPLKAPIDYNFVKLHDLVSSHPLIINRDFILFIREVESWLHFIHSAERNIFVRLRGFCSFYQRISGYDCVQGVKLFHFLKWRLFDDFFLVCHFFQSPLFNFTIV